MGTFGRTSQAPWDASIEDLIRGNIAQMDNVPGQQADSITAYISIGGEESSPIKAAIYDNENPRNLIAVTEEKSIDQENDGWITFNFSSPPALTANAIYFICVWSNLDVGEANDPAVKYSHTGEGDMAYKSETYNNYPATLVTSAPSIGSQVSVYCTYSTTPVGNPYPTDKLRKKVISGYHCFMQAYINAKIGGLNPLKLPDGTTF